MRKSATRKQWMLLIGVVVVVIVSLTTIYQMPSGYRSDANLKKTQRMLKEYDWKKYVDTYKDDDKVKGDGIHPNKKEHRKPASKPVQRQRADLNKKHQVSSDSASGMANSTVKLLSTNALECKHGGITLDGACVCSYPFAGPLCETVQDQDGCLVPGKFSSKNGFMYDVEPDAVPPKCAMPHPVHCCWAKHRRTNGTIFGNGNEDTHQAVSRMLNQYGPWDENDKLMMDYYFAYGEDSRLRNRYSPITYTLKTERPNLGFFLMFHHVDLQAIDTIMTNIYRAKHYYAIHVDRHVNDESLDQLKGLIREKYNDNNNVVILEKRFLGTWGAISLVYAELAGYATLVDMIKKREKDTGKKDQSWSHVINLSLNDFPTKPIIDLERFLGFNTERNFIDQDIPKREDRITSNWVECGRQMFTLSYDTQDICGNNENLYKSIDRTKYTDGSQWHFINLHLATHLISNMKSIERLFSMKYTLVPDETYFQLAYSESNLEDPWDSYNYRYIPWANPRLEVGIKDLDFPYVTYFARKVYTQETRDAITERYINFKKTLK
ncbi:hypothetical protein SAMD00019534_039220 [Acytostelium subglobosum LB1]|uniref:hypothetical protein n=1 Tax=Acytostelium subglobosum LB1 TaxID=1410327 RepID=UPI0006451F47|nr:hypothetical protein SAMD00019534_039220 [Acytostelium subglobosum LB1]GAM20747.1 hypothetical protein SAMD00019534_039220 [Acytostelium subglobosum LB1]|eukprot:XP_012755881.1 hypothetical protein SAMD00019534_039220 [Acytostelium subglobosum LB1]